jgi:acyl-CoA synthetase (AMP-forming)/AMP-acid ligase II
VSIDAVPELPYEPTLPVALRRAAALFGEGDFVVMPDRRLSFRAAEAGSRRLAKELLAAGVGKGTRVGIHLATGTEWAVAFLAAARIGALVMPFSTIYRATELQTALRIGDVSLLLAPATMLGKDHLVLLEDAVPGLANGGDGMLHSTALPYLRSVWINGPTDRRWARTFTTRAAGANQPVNGVGDDLLAAVEAEVSPADDLVAVFTSGTTAAPKAVVHTHGAVLRKTAPESDGGLDASFGGRVLSFMPFFWIGGLQSLTGALQSGAAVLTLERLDPLPALELAERERATRIQGNPTAVKTLLTARGDAADLPTLRPLHRRPWEREDAPGDTRHALGMTETVGVWASVPGFEHRVVDPDNGKDVAAGQVGEFWVRGYALMHGLYKREREETFTPDGWYRTGDLGHVDDDGHVHVHGRLSALIKSKGANVAPAEVEAVLNAAPGVRVAFVVGLEHAEFGQEVAAAIVVDDETALDVSELQAFVRERLSPYKVPSFITTIDEDEIPWLPSSKADARAITDLVGRRREAT